MKRVALALSLWLAAAVGTAVAAAAPTAVEVESALTCQCGCGLTVHACNHLGCGFAAPAKQEIARLVNEGLTKDQIVARFTARYGEKVRSSPTAAGFNLLAWTIPFVGLLAGAAMVGVVVVRWKRRTGAESAAAGTTAPHEAYRAKLDKELAELDR
jgi:cytochrome c-type biogenesis protein CcmH